MLDISKLSKSDKINIAKSMRDDGKTYQEIADEIGVHNSTVYRWLNEESMEKARLKTIEWSKSSRGKVMGKASAKSRYKDPLRNTKMRISNGKIHARKYGYVHCLTSPEEIVGKKTVNCGLCARHVETCGTLHLDHCHVTGIFRGWICQNCNWLLGFCKDSPDIIKKAVTYLEKQQ